jgi:hypothetical protein
VAVLLKDARETQTKNLIREHEHFEKKRNRKILSMAVNQKIDSLPISKCPKHEYERWLKGYLKKGGCFTHYHDYNFNHISESEREFQYLIRKLDRYDRSKTRTFQIATGDIKLLNGLCGSSSLRIIIPKHIKFINSPLGHSSLYMMKDFSIKGLTFVPSYSDLNL